MDEPIKVKIEAHGPEFWRLTISDAETGRILPVLWGPGHEVVLTERDGLLVARVELMVTEIDAEFAAEATERVEYLAAHGYEHRVRVRAAGDGERHYNLTINTSASPEPIAQDFALLGSLASGAAGLSPPAESVDEFAARTARQIVGGD